MSAPIIDAPKIAVELEEQDFREYLADLLKRLGVTEKLKKLSEEFKFDPLRIDIAYIKTIACDVVCPYSMRGVCILIDVIDHIVSKKLIEDSISARGVVSWLLSLFERELGFNLESLENLKLLSQDIYRYIAVVGPYLEVLVKDKKTVRSVTVETPSGKFRFKCLVVKLSTQDRRSFMVAFFHDTDRDILILRTANMFSDAVSEYCSLRELLTTAIIAKDVLLKLIS